MGVVRRLGRGEPGTRLRGTGPRGAARRRATGTVVIGLAALSLAVPAAGQSRDELQAQAQAQAQTQASTPASAQASAGPRASMPAWAELPDWSGVWAMIGPTVFDAATVEPRDGRAGTAGVREHPPYNDEWERKYEANIALVAADRFPDPQTTCGLPAGFPRILNLPDVFEFVVRPEQTWILAENGPNVLRIYTDGRGHPGPDDIFPTFMGDSVGHWEGDALVFDTIALRGEDGTIVDRTGLVLSDAAHIVTRMRKIDSGTIEARMVIEDAKALAAPWNVTKRYRRVPAGARVYDYACAENNRNPVTDSGRTLTLGPDGRPIDKLTEEAPQ
jgi:hypothetical protein